MPHRGDNDSLRQTYRMIIPNEVKTYKPFSKRRFTEWSHKTNLRYFPSKNEEIDVLYWQRYPTYDFIFGVPVKTNKYYGQEAGFFQYRDTRAKRVYAGFYVDKIELKQLAKGFNMLLKSSRKGGLKNGN